MSVQILVDSACDLPEFILNDFNIKVLPFHIHIDNDSYLDGENINTKEVYNYIKQGRYPKTSQVSPEQFRSKFVENAENGDDSLYISFSSRMSSAYQTGKLIADQVKSKYPDTKIEVIDSRGGSAATGILAYKAALLLKEGLGLDLVVEKIKLWTRHIEHIFILDDLKALQLGGRISKTKYIIGNAFKIKPVLQVIDGEIKLIKKMRGSKKAINAMVELLKEKSYDLKEQLIAITHADDISKAECLKEKIEEIGGEVFFIKLIGSVLGTHLGIGGLGVFFFNKGINEL